jgi:adenylate kinase
LEQEAEGLGVALEVGVSRGDGRTARGEEVREQVPDGARHGIAVPAQIGLVAERLTRPDTKAGFVLDGFPRTVAQAEALDRMLAEQGLPLDRVVCLGVSREELLRRLTGRRVCRQCGTAYHLESAPSRAGDRCDLCSGELYQRADDAPAAVARRLDVYEKQTAPLLAYYRRRGLLADVRGEGAMDAVTAEIRAAVRAAGGA